MKKMIFLLSMMCFTTTQLVGENKYSSDFYACEKASQSAYEINECLDKELKKQDKNLNVAYQKAIKEIQPFRRKSLREIQHTWIKYRDKKCTFYYHKESGSGGLTDAIQCELDMTIQRTIELNNIQ